MKRNKFSLYFIFISVLTFLAIFFSIVQKSYFNFTKPQKLVENNALLKEINPKLDLSILSTIKLKDKNIEENFDFSTVKAANSLIVTPIATVSSESLTPKTP